MIELSEIHDKLVDEFEGDDYLLQYVDALDIALTSLTTKIKLLEVRKHKITTYEVAMRLAYIIQDHEDIQNDIVLLPLRQIRDKLNRDTRKEFILDEINLENIEDLILVKDIIDKYVQSYTAQVSEDVRLHSLSKELDELIKLMGGDSI